MEFCKRKGVNCWCSSETGPCNPDYCSRNLPDVGSSSIIPKSQQFETGLVELDPKDTDFSVGAKFHSDTLVLNWGEGSCILLMGNLQPLDLRQIDFSEFTSIEINGNKFIKV